MIFILSVAFLCMPQLATAQSYREEGIASWYGTEFDGRPTASGEIFNSALFTAAHPTLPFGTFLKVTNRNNNRQITVKVNDRGPFSASRIIDLSKAAAEHLDMILAGVAPVIIETLPTGNLPALEAQPPAAPAAVVPLQPPVPAAAPEPAYTPPAAALAPMAPPVTPAPAAAPQAAPAPVAATPEPAAPAPAVAGTATPPGYGGPPITINVYQPPQAQSQSVQLSPSQAASTPAAPAQPPSPQPAPMAQAPELPPQAPQIQQPAPYPQNPMPAPPPPSPPPLMQPQVPPVREAPPAATPVTEWKSADTTITIELPPPQQQPPAVKFIPAITPAPDKKYRMQIGSYKIPHNAVAAFDKLKAVGLNPAYEQNGDLYRVVLGGIPGKDVEGVAYKLDKAGFREVIIRQEGNN
jgi:rare lipoprotein A